MAHAKLRLVLLAGVLCLLAAPAVAEECRRCHQTAVHGEHATLGCTDCHEGSGAVRRSAIRVPVACRDCHAGLQGVLHGPMARRDSERAFASVFARYDERFFDKNCGSCHLSSCLDCHGGNGHAIAAPRREDCHRCHRGYYVGADYWGLAPREDSLRYQRGAGYDGEKYLKMRPDIHAEAGLGCGDCHSMASLAAGAKSARGCRDCHRPDPRIVEHRIPAHLDKLECYACHSAWGAQEYGTFFLRLADNPVGEVFRVRGAAGSEYRRSAYLKRQDAPPLGWNAAGRLSPIRPQFIAYYSDLRHAGGVENILTAAQWKAFFPHTVRRGTVTCDGCHDEPRRFLLEPENRRIYRLDQDGMGLFSFWNSAGQTLVNGRFVTPLEFARFTQRSPEYIRGYVEKWQNFVQRVDTSSAP